MFMLHVSSKPNKILSYSMSCFQASWVKPLMWRKRERSCRGPKYRMWLKREVTPILQSDKGNSYLTQKNGCQLFGGQFWIYILDFQKSAWDIWPPKKWIPTFWRSILNILDFQQPGMIKMRIFQGSFLAFGLKIS